jgi:hypothetical protein
MRCAFTGWEGQRSTPNGKTHGHKLSQARQGGPVEHRDIKNNTPFLGSYLE